MAKRAKDELDSRFFTDPSLLLSALTHRSYRNENPNHPVPDNERLEFLGDALLGAFTAEALYRHQPELNEGSMTQLRAALVRAESLAGWARELGLGERLLLSRGEARQGGRQRTAVLAGAFEALIAAIALDRSEEVARAFALSFIEPALARLAAAGSPLDPKSRLQEWLQAHDRAAPEYQTIAVSGPAHAPSYRVQASEGEVVLAEGEGGSKQAAEQDAAAAALRTLEQTDALGE